jgi:DNA-binding NarL/FixJ family response regulator
VSESIRVFIVDDNRLLREGLVFMLAEEAGLEVVGSAENGIDALAQMRDRRPDIALVDIGIPGKDGIEVTKTLRQDLPTLKVIILGMPDVTNEIMACIEVGAAGYVLKEASFDHLVETIRSANRGESFCSPQIAASLFFRVAELAGDQIPESSVKLTPREVQIVNTIAEGLSNKEIAQKLSIEVQTVKNHVHNVLDKLQLHTRLEAVQYARERNLLNKNTA